jgi:DNA-binding FadR family transcriptional regulator
VILDMTRNTALREITQRVYDQLRLALWVEVRWLDQWKIALEEHRAIVTAVMSRDKCAAVAAARAHIRSSRENMQIIRQINQVRREDGQRAPMRPKTE